MRTLISCLDDGVNLLTVSDVSLIDLDDVDSWLNAIGMEVSERPSACRRILTEGGYTVSNVEHRITLVFKQ